LIVLGFLPRLPAPSLEPARTSATLDTTPLLALPLALETIDTEDTFVAISETASDLIANGRSSAGANPSKVERLSPPLRGTSSDSAASAEAAGSE
jgi:hypothetical protein